MVREILEKSACSIQAVLPQRGLTALVHRLMRIRVGWIKNLQIRLIGRMAGVHWHEAASPDPDDYVHFNAFFTRGLKPGARPIEGDERTLVSPCDGRISELGRIDGDRLYQAKNRCYTLSALLANDAAVTAWRDGHFATTYLAPRDYHRVHMPLAGRLVRMTYVPGRLFSVAPYTVRHVDGLFAVNERVICHFETRVGPVAVILVGAMLVNGLETVWAGAITPRRERVIETTDYPDPGIELARGDELGRFNMGSTVLILLPDGAVAGDFAARSGERLKMGQALARLSE